MVRNVIAGVILIATCISFAAAAPKPNFVLITVDSFRADRMGFFGGKGTLTPNLDRLAAESIVFEHAYAQAPSSVDSHASILSGAYPQNTGMTAIGGLLLPTLPYLPDLLKSQTYRTGAFVSSIDLDPQNGLAQGCDRGFETYDAGFRPVIPGDARQPLNQRSGDQVVAHAITWLDHNLLDQKSAAPFFMWVHLSDVSGHSLSDNAYNSAVTVEDAAVEKLLTALKQRKLYGNTAAIVVGAVGESLGAHGEDTHGIFLYDETIHVPLLLKLPEEQVNSKPATVRVSGKVRLVDIAPTLLEIASVAVPSQMSGQSLLRIAKAHAGSDQPVYSKSDLPQRGFGWSGLESWRAGKYLYVRAPKPELYDLAADPGATHNLAQSSKATLDTMSAQLDNFDRHFTGETAKSSAELSSSEMQKLASLGYIGLQKTAGPAAAVGGIDPKDAIATANKVMAAAREQAKPDRAIQALEPLVSNDPKLYLAQYTLGVALARKGQYSEAVKHLHQAVELQPDSAWAHYEIGAALMKTGDFKTAAVHLEIAAGRLPEFAPGHLALAGTYEHTAQSNKPKSERDKDVQK